MAASSESGATATRCVGVPASSVWRWPVDVLVQRPAARDVERLRAAADAEHRQAGGVGGAGDGELEGVVLGVGRAELAVALQSAVGDGVEVGAAGQADAVEARDERRARPRGRRRRARPGWRRRLRSPSDRWSRASARRAARRPRGRSVRSVPGRSSEVVMPMSGRIPVFVGIRGESCMYRGANRGRPGFARVSNRLSALRRSRRPGRGPTSGPRPTARPSRRPAARGRARSAARPTASRAAARRPRRGRSARTRRGG